MKDTTGDMNGWVDRYVDGDLSAADRAEFEGLMRIDPNLGAQLEARRRLDESLRRLFTAPEAGAILARLPSGAKGGAARATSRRWRIVGGAMAALLGLGMWGTYQGWIDPLGVFSPSPGIAVGIPSLGETYRAVAEKEPDWICENDREFAEAFKRTLGVELVMGRLPEGVSSRGMRNTSVISKNSLILLAKVNERPVIVCVGRQEDDRANRPAVEGDLHIFKRSMGALVLYEVTPLEDPRLLELFRPYHADGDETGASL